MPTEVQVGEAAAGSVEVRRLPRSSTATQRPGPGQEMPVISAGPKVLEAVSTRWLLHWAAVEVGSDDTRTRPTSSPAAQKLSDGHEIAVIPVIPSLSIFATDHAPAPPAGLVEVRTLAETSVAAQSVAEAQ